ncbi:MAG: hypothetical protein NXI10_12450 [bacterium]|nr:hypothetical protein [bacterium]
MTRTISSSYYEVFDSSISVLKQLGWSMNKVDKTKGEIIASVRISLWSWGERVLIELTNLRGSVSVEIKSVAKAQLFTWGKNRLNEEKFLDMLSREMRKSD